MNKKVLLIGIGHYDYEKSICTQFEAFGYNVDFYSETPPASFLFRFYSRFKIEKGINKVIEKFSSKISEKVSSDYHLIFIINARYLAGKDIIKIKSKNPSAKTVLYIWDSLIRLPNVENKFKYFDDIYSFDRYDCINNPKIQFNPTFFREEYKYKPENDRVKKKYDLYHIGWYHSDRLKLILKIVDYCNDNNLSHKMLIYTGRINYYMQKIFGGELKKNKEHLIFQPISAQKNHEYICESGVLLDIVHPLQAGLTMRVYESLAMRKKLITTNSDIVNYNFYNPNNILIIDRENPILNLSFFETNFQPINEEIMHEYSIESWLKRMLKKEISQ